MSQLDFSDIPEQPASRATDPVTSALAGLAPKRARGKRSVLRVLHQHGPMHDEKISRLTGLRLGSASKRRHDLVTMGLVEMAYVGGEPLYTKTTSGSQALVWRITFAGRSAAQQLPPEEDDVAAAEARREQRRQARITALLGNLEDYLDGRDQAMSDLHELRSLIR